MNRLSIHKLGFALGIQKQLESLEAEKKSNWQEVKGRGRTREYSIREQVEKVRTE